MSWLWSVISSPFGVSRFVHIPPGVVPCSRGPGSPPSFPCTRQNRAAEQRFGRLSVRSEPLPVDKREVRLNLGLTRLTHTVQKHEHPQRMAAGQGGSGQGRRQVESSSARCMAVFQAPTRTACRVQWLFQPNVPNSSTYESKKPKNQAKFIIAMALLP